MFLKKECVAMLLAGGQGSRLYALTQDVAKPAVPFGGKYRIIDFPLSNCINSGIDTVGVLTQYQPLVLNEYIGNGQPWDLDRIHGGVHVLPPYQKASGADWYSGTANAIYQNIPFIERYDPEYVVVLSGDHIYKMDYNKMLNFHKDKNVRKMFMLSMEKTVNQLKNHPCICYWTIFNEGWGQFDSDNVYEIFKKLDDTRFIDSTSGWFRRKKTDVDSRHVYFKPIKLKAGDKPLVLSEFGGYSFKPEGHVFNTEQTYGYGKFENQQEFAEAVEKLYREQVIPAAKTGLCAAIYTQVSDVEDETNGLRSYDRKVEKLTPERMKPIAKELEDAMRGATDGTV